MAGPPRVGPEMVDEAPGADRPDVAVRQGAPDEHRAGPAERDLARLEEGEPVAHSVVGVGERTGVRLGLERAHDSHGTCPRAQAGGAGSRRPAAQRRRTGGERATAKASTISTSLATSAPPEGSVVMVRMASTA